MKVLLDATAVPADRGGVGRYVDELVPRLVRAGCDVGVLTQARDVPLFEPSGAQLVVAPSFVSARPARLAWEQAGIPALVRRARPDVLHSPHYTMPLLTGTPVVVTVHDATFFSHPEVHIPTKGRFFRAWSRVSARRASGIVVPSEATGDEVVRWVHADRSRVTVAYHGVDSERFRPVSDRERMRVRATLDIGDAPYVAFLGTLEPRKNVPALVRAWVAVCAGLARPPALVLAGGRGWDDRLDAELARVPSHLTVRRPGYLPMGDLAGFLSGAAVVAYPSMGEGFGLPVLEAMACGATVLTTPILSLPEIGGDAVAYRGTGEDEIADGLRQLLSDEHLRTDLARRALVRAAGFTWEASAAAHIAAYERAVARPR